MSILRVDVGCGLNIKKPVDEWIHLDGDEGPHIEWVTDFADIPTDDETVDEIWIGDVIEHIPAWRSVEVMKEWHRVLKPSGKLNGTTPNLDYNARQYVNGEITLEWFLQNLYGDRAAPPHQHYILYTRETLEAFLKQHNFANFSTFKSPGPPDNPWWFVFEAYKA